MGRILVLALVALLGLAGPTNALTLVDDAADLVLLPGPADFTSDGPHQSDTQIFVFQEADQLILASDLTVNATAPGTYAASPGTSVIGAGTEIDSFFIHMDVFSTTTHGGGGATAGSIVFDGIILGVIAEGAELDASDPIVGDPASSYQPAAANRWFWENNDVLTISADRRTLTIDSIRVGSSQPYSDTIRVIIQAPEPGPAGLFALGLAAFGAARRRGARLSSPG